MGLVSRKMGCRPRTGRRTPRMSDLLTICDVSVRPAKGPSGSADKVRNTVAESNLLGARIDRLLGRDLRDLVALDAEARHEALLSKDEGVDVVLERLRRGALPHPLVHDHDARA